MEFKEIRVELKASQGKVYSQKKSSKGYNYRKINNIPVFTMNSFIGTDNLETYKKAARQAKNEEFIIALSGSFDVLLDDGHEQQVFSLNRSYYGLYVPNGVWRQMQNFSTNSLALVLASTSFDSDDYIYDYELFKVFVK